MNHNGMIIGMDYTTESIIHHWGKIYYPIRLIWLHKLIITSLIWTMPLIMNHYHIWHSHENYLAFNIQYHGDDLYQLNWIITCRKSSRCSLTILIIISSMCINETKNIIPWCMAWNHGDELPPWIIMISFGRIIPIVYYPIIYIC